MGIEEEINFIYKWSIITIEVRARIMIMLFNMQNMTCNNTRWGYN
jgi:hypothetical protein